MLISPALQVTTAHLCSRCLLLFIHIPHVLLCRASSEYLARGDTKLASNVEPIWLLCTSSLRNLIADLGSPPCSLHLGTVSEFRSNPSCTARTWLMQHGYAHVPARSPKDMPRLANLRSLFSGVDRVSRLLHSLSIPFYLAKRWRRPSCNSSTLLLFQIRLLLSERAYYLCSSVWQYSSTICRLPEMWYLSDEGIEPKSTTCAQEHCNQRRSSERVSR